MEENKLSMEGGTSDKKFKVHVRPRQWPKTCGHEINELITFADTETDDNISTTLEYDEKSMTFDSVFPPSTSQEDVLSHITSEYLPKF